MKFQQNKSLTDGLVCLQALCGTKEAIGCRELAGMLDLEVTRVNRFLLTLLSVWLVEQDEKRRYRPGPGIHILAAQCIHGSKLLNSAIPILEKISHPGYVIALGVLWRDKVSYLFHRNSGSSPYQAMAGRPYYNASASSIGRVLLAEKGPDYVNHHYSGHEIPGFEGDLENFKKRLMETKWQGYSFLEDAMGEKHLHNIAVPVGNPAIAALAFSKIPPEMEVSESVSELNEIAAEISRDMNQ